MGLKNMPNSLFHGKGREAVSKLRDILIIR